jgi:hypothetical protein
VTTANGISKDNKKWQTARVNTLKVRQNIKFQ